MSNPFNDAAAATYPKGPGQIPDNVTSLANNTAKGLGSVGVTLTQQANEQYLIQVKTGTGGNGGPIELHQVVSLDGAVWSNFVDPDSTSDQHTKLDARTQIDSIPATTDSTSYSFTASNILAKSGDIPIYRAFVLYNKSGAALSSAAGDHYAKFVLVTFS